MYFSPHILRPGDLKGISTKRYSLVEKTLQKKIQIDGAA